MRLAVVGSVLAVVTVFCLGCGKSDKPANAAGQQVNSPAQPASVVTKENYLKIQIGMRADDLKLLLGKPTSERDFYKGTVEPMDWHWKDGKKSFYVELVIKDGAWVVKNKNQFGLD